MRTKILPLGNRKPLPLYVPRLGDGIGTCYEPRRARARLGVRFDLAFIASTVVLALIFAALLQYGLPLAMVIITALGEVAR